MNTCKVDAHKTVFIIRHIQRMQHKPGTFFSAVVIKRGNKESRTFNCRLGVNKGVTGEGRRFVPKNKNLIGVWDRVAKNFRLINCDRLNRLQVCGIVLIEDGEKTAKYLEMEKAADVFARLDEHEKHD